MVKLFHNILELGDRRRELRKKATSQEKLLWEKLRNKKLGPRFRRQYSIGGYILDFYCAEKKLIIEIDGEIHNTLKAIEYDLVRDKFFRGLGYKTLRVKNDEVDKNIQKVLEIIRGNLR